MFSLINIVEIYTFAGIQILFFVNFLSIFFLSYASGYLIINKRIKDNTFQYSLISLILFATIIAIIVNLNVSYAKYIITIFYFLNILIFAIKKSVRRKFIEIVKKNINFFLLVFFLYIFLINFINPVTELNNIKINVFYLDDDSYSYNPVREILFSTYSSRIRISTLYPMEWGSYYFFQAAFNSIFLKTISSSGLIGYLYLKNFFLSFFYSLLISYCLNKNLFKKKNVKISVFFSFLIFLIIFFFHKASWNIFTNGFVSVLIILLIADLFVKNKNKDIYLWSILLAITSFKYVIISFFIYFFNFFKNKNFNLKSVVYKFKQTVVYKFKQTIGYLDIAFVLVFLIYFISTFAFSTAVNPTFNLPDKIPNSWWNMTISLNTIKNQYILGYNFLFLALFYFFLIKKKYVKIYLKYFNLKVFYYLLILFTIPLFCTSLFFYKSLLADVILNKKLAVFLSTVNFNNLVFYCCVPVVWFLFFVNINNSIKYLFLLLITIHTFLAIFIENAIIVPSIYIIELFILFYSYFYVIKNGNNFKKNLFIYFFIFIIFTNYVLIQNSNDNRHTIRAHISSITLNILELKRINKKEFLCPEDIEKMTINVERSDLETRNSISIFTNAISSLLLKNYYPKISYLDNFNRYNHWSDGSARWAVVPKKIKRSLCSN